MLTADQLHTRLAGYVLGEISLPDFEDWFVSESWDVHQTGDQELQRLVFEIEARLSEYSGGSIEEDRLRGALASFAGRHPVDVTSGEC